MRGHALLIGVPEYESDAIQNLAFAANDVTTLAETFAGIGYEVDTLGVDGRLATRSHIISTVFDACRSASQNETLVIYFSGHGLHIEGKDFLVPADAALHDDIIEDLLVPVDFSRAITESPARAVLFFFDACREGVELGEKGALSLQKWTNGRLETVAHRDYAYVFSCGPGEVSRFVGGEEGFSLFGRALSDAFREPRERLTFGQLRKELQARLDGLAERNQKKPQRVRVTAEVGADDRRLSDLELWRAKSSTGKPEVSDLSSVDFGTISDYKITTRDLRLLSVRLDGAPPWLNGRVTAVHLVRVANEFNEPIGSVVASLRRFEAVGLVLPGIDDARVDDLRPTTDDVRALSITQPENPAGFIGGPSVDAVGIKRVVLASHALGESIGAVLERLERFVPLGIQLPSLDSDEIRAVQVTEEDLEVLRQFPRSDDVSYVGRAVPVGHVLSIALRHHDPIEVVLERLRRFESLGTVLPTSLQKASGPVDVEPVDMQLLSADLDGAAPWIGEAVSSLHIMRASVELSVTAGEALRRIRALQPVSVVSRTADGHPTVIEADPDTLDELQVSETDLRLLLLDDDEPGSDEEDQYVIGSIPAVHAVIASNRTGQSIREVVARLAEFAPLGVELTNLRPEAVPDVLPESADLLVLSRDLDAIAPYVHGPVPPRHLVRASAATGETLGVVVGRIKALSALGVDVAVTLPSKLVDTVAAREDAEAIRPAAEILEVDEEVPWQYVRLAIFDPEVTVPAIDVVQAAAQLTLPIGKVLERLSTYRGMGFEPPDMDLDLIKDLTVSDDDMLLLSRDLDSQRPWIDGVVSPVHILRVANRFGETVGETVVRFRRLEALGIFELQSDLAALADATVSQQMLELVSVGLDGRAPWVDERVSPIHIIRAANHLNEPVGSIMDRLRPLSPAVCRLPRSTKRVLGSFGSRRKI